MITTNIFSNYINILCLFKDVSVLLYVSSFFFFFQAEDGIRDIGVTGVQTCALPIYGAAERPPVHAREPLPTGRARSGAASGRAADPRPVHQATPRPRRRTAVTPRRGDRESVGEGKRVDVGGRRIIKKKKNDKHGQSV